MIEIRRSKSSLLVIPIGFSVLFLAWGLHQVGIIQIDGFSEPVFNIWALLFLLPVIGYFVLLWPKRKLPILTLTEEFITFRSGLLLQKCVSLPTSIVVDISTNWRGPNTESWCDLIFVVEPEAAASLEHAGVLRLKNGDWHFEFSTAECTAFEAVELIKEKIA